MNQTLNTTRLDGGQIRSALMSVALLGLIVAPELALAAPGVPTPPGG